MSHDRSNRHRSHVHPDSVSDASDSSASSSAIPDQARNFIRNLAKAVRNRSIYDLTQLYEHEWSRISDRSFKGISWPSSELVEPLIEREEAILVLYRDLYFRHIYSRMTPTIDDRFDSFQNYIDLFNLLIHHPDESNAPFELPNAWLWDLIDEFIYQFQSFQIFRHRAKDLTPQEIQLLKDNSNIWSPPTVLRYLHALVHKAAIDSKQLAAIGSNNKNPTEVPSIYRNLGYYALVGLLRVNCLLCDYSSALRSLDCIDLRRHRSQFTSVLTCHVTLYYYLGFSYLMCRRYTDAIKIFSYFLTFISRSRHQIQRSHASDAIVKRVEQMQGLLGMAYALSPEPFDDSILNEIREKLGEKLVRMQKGDLSAYEEVFFGSAPKFIHAASPNYEAAAAAAAAVAAAQATPAPEAGADGVAVTPVVISESSPVNPHVELRHSQWSILAQEVTQRATFTEIYAHLKLFSSISVQKLAQFLKQDEQTVLSNLLKLKHKTRQLRWAGGAPNDGKYYSSAEVEFTIAGNMIEMSESKSVRRFGDYFMKSIGKLDEIARDVQTIGRR
jgi:translation initiation factor 3 subunit L